MGGDTPVLNYRVCTVASEPPGKEHDQGEGIGRPGPDRLQGEVGIGNGSDGRVFRVSDRGVFGGTHEESVAGSGRTL